MDADLVTRAVCSGFVEKPKECQDLIAPRDPMEKFKGMMGKAHGVNQRWFVGGLCSMVLFVFGIFICYRRALRRNLQKAVREEVMLEVQAAMTTYNRLHGQDL